MTLAPRKRSGSTKPTGSSRASPQKASASKPAVPRAPRIAPTPSATESSAGGGGTAGRVSVRVYRQGLGDCILVSVKRPGDKDFKLMIDCGLVLGVRDKNPVETMTRVVDNLVTDTGGEVDVLAITHEHWDHLSGFNQAKDSFKKLTVGEVWVAWTEDLTDDLANQLRKELTRAKQALGLCATALHAAGNPKVQEMLADLALTPFGAAASNSTAAAFEAVKTAAVFKNTDTKPALKIWCPASEPVQIPNADARFYVLGPPHNGKLIRKINPSTRNPETYGLALNGDGALSQGVIAALRQMGRELTDEEKLRLGLVGDFGVAEDDEPQDADIVAPFHQRMTIPLPNQKGLDLFDGLDSKGAIKTFFRANYYDADSWRRIDADWLGSAPELAMAIQSFTNNTSSCLRWK